MLKILYGGKARSEEYRRYVICKEFGWDYYTYERQPARFIDEVTIIMQQETQHQENEANKQRRKMQTRKRR